MKQKKIPMRKCTGCGEMKPKSELVRVVKAPDKVSDNGEVLEKGEISLDLTSKKSGRGAYICKSLTCLKKVRKSRRLEHNLECPISPEVYDRMEAELSEEAET